MYGYIYKTTNLVTGKIYIGQKKSKRFKGNAYLGSGKKLKDAINKYGKDAFNVELLEEIDCLEKMDDREIYWISYYDSTNKDIGYNMSNGGNVNRALSGENHPLYHKGHTLESRKKMSDSHKGVPLSKEHIQRRVESRKGYHHSDETKRKISKSNSLVKQNSIWVNDGIHCKQIKKEELDTYLKLGFVRGRIHCNSNIVNKKKVICIETQIVYDSIAEAERLTGIKNIVYCCKEKRNKAGGYHWQYVKEI